MKSPFHRASLSRRSALGLMFSTTGVALVAACTPAAAPTPTAAPKPAATTAPAASAVPAASPAAAPGASPAASAVASPAAAAPRTGPLDTVTVGCTAIIASAGLFVAQDLGYFRDEGLDVQITVVTSGNDTLPLVATGRMDVANNAVTAFMVNAVNDGVAMKWVAGQASYTPKHGTLGLVVKKDLFDNGTIKELKDLRGKKVTVPVLNGGGAIVMDKALNKIGMSNKDIDLGEMSIANMPAALQNGAIDACMPAEPIVTNTAAQGIGHILMYADAMYPGMEATQWMYSPQFASQRADVGVRFMTGLLKGARRYNDAMLRNVNRQQVLDILIKNTSVKDPTLYDRMQLSELNANGSLNAANMQEQVDWLFQWNHVRAKVDVSKLIDTTFVDQATAKIGKV